LPLPIIKERVDEAQGEGASTVPEAAYDFDYNSARAARMMSITRIEERMRLENESGWRRFSSEGP